MTHLRPELAEREYELLRAEDARRELAQMQLEHEQADRAAAGPTMGDDCAELLEGWYREMRRRGDAVTWNEVDELARRMRAVGRG